MGFFDWFKSKDVSDGINDNDSNYIDLDKRTVVSFLLDASGSMSSCIRATQSGYSEFVDSLKQDQGDAVFFNLTFFPDNATVRSGTNALREEMTPIKAVKADLRDYNYTPAGLTPLYDAIGTTIRAMESKVRSSDNIIFVIMTDGGENASSKYNLSYVQEKIRQKTGDGWKFVFLGADIDAYAAGGALGIDKSNTVSYSSSKQADAMHTVAMAATTMRSDYAAGREIKDKAFFTAEQKIDLEKRE